MAPPSSGTCAAAAGFPPVRVRNERMTVSEESMTKRRSRLSASMVIPRAGSEPSSRMIARPCCSAIVAPARSVAKRMSSPSTEPAGASFARIEAPRGLGGPGVLSHDSALSFRTGDVAARQLAMASALARARVHSAAGTCRQAPLVQATKMSCTLPSNVRSSICEQRSDGPMP